MNRKYYFSIVPTVNHLKKVEKKLTDELEKRSSGGVVGDAQILEQYLNELKTLSGSD